MTLSIPLLIPLISLLPTITALPIPHLTARAALSRRSHPSNKSLGIGFGVTFGILILGAIIFYLGVCRGQTGTWFCWREPAPQPEVSTPTRSPTILSEKISVIDPDQLKTRISCPMPMHSTTLPELSPVEPGANPKFELDSKITERRQTTIHEMGDSTPRRPLSAMSIRKSTSFGKADRKSRYRSSSRSKSTHRRLTSVMSTKTLRKSTLERKSTFYRKSRFHFGDRRSSIFDRGSWFCQGAMEIEEEVRRGRETSIETLPVYPGPAVVRDSSESVDGVDKELTEAKKSVDTFADTDDVEKETTGKRVPTMDWSGMEWLRGVYAERKSKFKSFHPRDEKPEGSS